MRYGMACLAGAVMFAAAACESLPPQSKTVSAVPAASANAIGFATGKAAPTGLETIVKLDSGYVVGRNGPIRSYKGIPYAAAPVGELRWKPPQPVKPWTDVKLATDFGPQCVQGRGASISGSEDCLTLNVWTPAQDADAKLPVLVWIHGGAFETGSGAAPTYNGEALASEGIVVVTINYRLGPFGFFAHPELSKENPEGVSGNQAVLDMVASLNWVKTNIAAFGGNPADVTIMGESAGGTAMGLMLLTPKAKGLFSKAVAESPWGYFQPTSHLKQKWYGRPSAEEDGASKGSLADLRAKSVGDVMAMPRPGGATNHQIVDGVVLTDDPTDLLQAGKVNPAKLIVGTNRDEGTIFARPSTTLEDAKKNVAENVTPGAEALLAAYGGKDDATANAGVRGVVGDSLFLMGARELARAVDRNSDAWQYEFTRVSGGGARAGLGAFHASDIPYWFRNLPLIPFIGGRVGLQPGDFNETDARLSKEMSGYLVNFIKTGDPNGAGLPQWPKFGEGGEQHIEFAADGAAVKSGIRTESVDTLRNLYLKLREKR